MKKFKRNAIEPLVCTAPPSGDRRQALQRTAPICPAMPEFLKDQNERAFMDIEIATDLKQQKVGVMKAKALGIQARNRGSMSTLVSRHLYLPYD